NGLGKGSAATVAGDGAGNIFCSCQAHDLALQLYGITEYDATGSKPKLVRSFYGIFGNLGNQIPSAVLHIDPVTQTIYVGFYTPAFVIALPVNSKSGKAPSPRIIGGVNTTLFKEVASLTTDAAGNLYVAAGSTIAVFGPKASGDVAPNRIISDPKNLQYL